VWPLPLFDYPTELFAKGPKHLDVFHKSYRTGHFFSLAKYFKAVRLGVRVARATMHCRVSMGADEFPHYLLGPDLQMIS